MKETIKEPIRALSWKEPYGSLMLPPNNKIETRTWDTKYRGLVLMCASKLSYSWSTVREISGSVQFDRILSVYSNKEFKEEYNGKAFAIGRLIDSRPMKKSDEDLTFCEFYSGLFCHVYSEVRHIEPFTWKGTQGWKTLNEEEKSKIILL